MNVSRKFIGKIVELQWVDPNSERVDFDKLEKGRVALSTWKEYGVVLDVTDGVVLLAHSFSYDSTTDTVASEVHRTSLPEALIESLTVLEPVKDVT